MELSSAEREKTVGQVWGGDEEENQFNFGHIKFDMSIKNPNGGIK